MDGYRGQPDGLLFDPAKIDVVAMSPDGAAVELVIIADGPWTGSDEQVNSLQQKVQTYVSYAVDGAMVSAHPGTERLPWRIGIRCYAGAPDGRTSQLLEVLAHRLPAYGGSLIVQQF